MPLLCVAMIIGIGVGGASIIVRWLIVIGVVLMLIVVALLIWVVIGVSLFNVCDFICSMQSIVEPLITTPSLTPTNYPTLPPIPLFSSTSTQSPLIYTHWTSTNQSSSLSSSTSLTFFSTVSSHQPMTLTMTFISTLLSISTVSVTCPWWLATIIVIWCSWCRFIHYLLCAAFAYCTIVWIVMSIRVAFVVSFIAIAWAAHSPPVSLSPPHSAHLSLTTYLLTIQTTSEWYFIIDTFLIDNVAIVVSHAPT